MNYLMFFSNIYFLCFIYIIYSSNLYFSKVWAYYLLFMLAGCLLKPDYMYPIYLQIMIFLLIITNICYSCFLHLCCSIRIERLSNVHTLNISSLNYDSMPE